MADQPVAPAKSRWEIAGKTVFITGAEGGLGTALVSAFVRAGCARVLAATRGVLPPPHGTVEPVLLDITDGRHVSDAAAKYARDVDILVNNAGQNHNTRFLDVDEDNASREIQVNYLGTLRMVRAFAPAMRQRGRGLIVNLITIGSQVSFPNMGSYCASKAALHLMTQSIRAELGYYGVDVVGVYPAAIDTPMSVHVPAANKISPEQAANEMIIGLRNGREDIYIGMAAELHDRLRREPKAVEAMLKVRVAPSPSRV
jgi:NAD(P)-dependent dehydrogenase (short-subunit alcohol dehydrogenase family)